ncbi:hypothetical protein C1H76_4651 [Elsinoe australis]|uniref:SMP-LTD domain-containing protein n=1 Tax=Elsinoe australis TaxID=40998 RepID=A0A4U7AX30_9PEZI|nr:hypothetical protein C1H76_4651 [Elsinoe australis]
MSLRTLFIVYVVGGLTFIPLVLLSIFVFAYYTLPRVPQKTEDTHDEPAKKLTSDSSSDLSRDDGFVDKEDAPGGSGNDAAGYFAVCREYVPGGVNGKPPERSSPAGEVLNTESPSVYQSMYRSIFERNKTQAHALDGDKKDHKAVKRPRNVFFVVLRHEHLLLFDNSEQLEVRHVISLLYHDVDIYGGDEELAEGDLWIKKNCIRLTRRSLPGHPGATSQPFYIFSDNCSEKEDFYHALLHAQSSVRDNDSSLCPKPRRFETDDIIKLVQALHTIDSDHHARWFNAVLGRVFLALYKTDDIKMAIKSKIDRKISRVPKPNFITSIQVQSVDMGNAAPVFSNFKLRELMVDGSLTIETDVKYNGGFRLQIAAIARIELGSRIRAREVDLVLAGVLRKLSGHLLIKIKPPPSNRLWISFETIPQMDLSVEPVVSSMQITYGVILRAIESRIREVVGETLVYPNWDDMPFFDTDGYDCRGGIWDAPRKDAKDAPTRDTVSEVIHTGISAEKSPKLESGGGANGLEDVDKLPPLSPKTISMPNLIPSPTKDVSSRKLTRKSVSSAEPESASSAVSMRSTSTATPPQSKPSSPRMAPADRPKAMRSNSFASAATPLVSTDDATSTVSRARTPKAKGQRDAVELVKEVKSRSESQSQQKQSSPESSNKTSLDANDLNDEDRVKRSNSDATHARDSATDAPNAIPIPSATFPLPDLNLHRKSWANLSSSPPSGSAFEKATSMAKNWGISMMNRQSGRNQSVSGFTSLAKEAGLEDETKSAPSAAATAAAQAAGQDTATMLSSVDTMPAPGLNSDGAPSTATKQDPEAPHVNDNKDPPAKAAKDKQPMGRGQPLPPPGAPLPGPRQSLWAGSNFGLTGTFKRKAVPGASGASAAMHGSGAAAVGPQEMGGKGVDEPTGTYGLKAEGPERVEKGAGHRRAVSAGRRRRSSALHLMDEEEREVLVVPSPDEGEGEEGTLGAEAGTAEEGEARQMMAGRGAGEIAGDDTGEEKGCAEQDLAATARDDFVAPGIETRIEDRDTRDEHASDAADMPPPLPSRPGSVPAQLARTAPAAEPQASEAPDVEQGNIDTSTSDAVVEDEKTHAPVHENREEKVAVEREDSVRSAGRGGSNNSGGSVRKGKGKGGWYMGAVMGGGTMRGQPAGQVKRVGKEKGD